MAKTTTPKIMIDDVEYDYESMTQEQQTLVNHVVDLDRKMQQSMFQLDQLKVGKEAFIGLLKGALAKEPQEESPQDIPPVNIKSAGPGDGTVTRRFNGG